MLLLLVVMLMSLVVYQVAGAAIDAFEHEPLAGVSKALSEHANVICTPHIGTSWLPRVFA